MATLQVRLSDLATRIASECKTIRTLLNGNATDLSALTTTAKGNLVSAINELKQEVQRAAESGGATINDAVDVSTTQTYSITKIQAELAETATAVKNEILNGAGAAYDTLAELQALLEGDAAELANITTALGNRVRTDTAAQGLTAQQKLNARTNIGADITSAEIGNPDTDLVAVFTSGLI
jgi:hypothetical protein